MLDTANELIYMSEYHAQVNAVGSWNQNEAGTREERDAPWGDHPNFRWTDLVSLS